MANLTNQVNDINAGIGPAVGKFDSGNGFGTRVFWIAAIPASDLTVNLAAGTAELKVQNLAEYDYNNFADSDQTDWQFPQSADHPHGYFDASVSFDIVWNGPVMHQDKVADAANGFAGVFSQNDATVTWSASSMRPVGNSHFTYTSNPGNTSTSNSLVGPGLAFVQLASEQNGIFFPSGAALQVDPVNPSLTDLVVNGSSTGGVHIQVQSIHGGKDIQVQIHGAAQNYQAEFPTAAIARLIVNSGPGDNHIEVSNNVKVPAILMGDYGNDHIQAGGAPTVLLGGAGNDILEGGPANDIFIGGGDADRLRSLGGNDILIGGTTNFDNNLPALIALMTEWGRSDESYAQRVANLSNSTVNGVAPVGGENGGTFLNAATVQDDAAANTLEGGPALDWFFAGAKDKLKDHKSGEVVVSLH